MCAQVYLRMGSFFVELSTEEVGCCGANIPLSIPYASLSVRGRRVKKMGRMAI